MADRYPLTSLFFINQEEDTWILSGDVYIVRAIAEYLIENELGISKTILSDKKEFE